MKDIYDINMGFSYVEVTSRPKETEKKHGSFGSGLMIAISFPLMVLIMFAVA